MVPEVDLATFAAAHADGAVVIDVREPYEYVAGHVPGARLVPLARLPHHAGELPAREPVYVICASGNRSWTAAQFLAGRGIDAKSVIGGTGDWMASGLPVVRGAQENVA
ncbi:MAG TPA: sulfurtransferase [Actinobacteria bacterium]|nr:sulfurtransferase [Actinomycetota bacterium]